MTVRPQQGFTLLELMVALAVMAVLITLAVPSFTSYILNQRVKTSAFELAAALSYARSEAIKLNTDIQLVRDSADWNGWSMVRADDDSNVLRVWVRPGRLDIATDPDVSSISFQRDGRADSLVTFAVCDADGSGQVIRRLITLDPSGRASLSRGANCDV